MFAINMQRTETMDIKLFIRKITKSYNNIYRQQNINNKITSTNKKNLKPKIYINK